MRICSFSPVVGPDPILLILGSMPGVRSLAMHEYYAHPQNSFWSILGSICGFDPKSAYPFRLGRMMAARIALWDSLQACERPGSLDSRILPHSEVPNDIPGLLQAHPTIEAVAFNGSKAWLAFERRILPALPIPDQEHLKFIRLPSTSPANANLRPSEKLLKWKEALSPYLL